MLFFGAGNIAQSIMKGIIKSQPAAADQIMATAPSTRNLQKIDKTLGCRTSLLSNLSSDKLEEFQPNYVFLCMKPQNFLASMERKNNDVLYNLLHSMPKDCTIFSLIAGLRGQCQTKAIDRKENSIIRVMLNTAAEHNSSSVFYYSDDDIDVTKRDNIDKLFNLIGSPVIRLSNENLMDVATGMCGSGIAFFYEMIQVISDVGVKNGLSRADSALVAAQLSVAAGQMVINRDAHPYQLRDEVCSPAGTTIYGLGKWHEQATSQKIHNSVQTSIDRSRELSKQAIE